MKKELYSLLKSEGVNNTKILSTLPLISSAMIFFQSQFLILWAVSVTTSIILYSLLELFTGNKIFYKNMDLLFVYMIIIFPLLMPAHMPIAGAVTGSFIFSSFYVFLKKNGKNFLNPLIMGWAYIFFIYKQNYILPEPSLLLKNYSNFNPDLVTGATPVANYFLYGKDFEWSRIFLGLSLGTPAEIFIMAIFIGLFLQIALRAISYRIIFTSVAGYIIPPAIYFFVNSGYIINMNWLNNIKNFIILGPFIFILTFILDDGFSLPSSKKLKLFYGIIFGVLSSTLLLNFKLKCGAGYILIFLPVIFFIIENKFYKNKSITTVASDE